MRIGIMGCGGIAKVFAQAVHQVGGITLAAAAKDQARAEAFAKDNGAVAAYGSYEAMVQEEKLDAVYIATTHNSHYELIELCLNHQIAVLCEKPMVLTEAQAQALFDLAKEKDTLLVEAMWTKMQKSFLMAKEWVEAGRIGQVRLVETSFGSHVPFNPTNRFYNPDLAGGAMYDLGVYNLQFTCGILSTQPEEVTGSAIVGTTGVDESSLITMRFPNGVLGLGVCSFHVTTDHKAVIYGEKGKIVVSHFYACRKISLQDTSGQEIDTYEVEEVNGFVYQVRHFVQLLKENKKESDLVTPADTIGCAKIFDTLNRQWGIS